MRSKYYTLYGIKLPRPNIGPAKKYDLQVGRRKISKNNKGARRLKKIIENWDYFALNQENFYKHVGTKYMNLRVDKLKDPVYKKYPFYILDYDHELKKIVSIMKRVLKNIL